jgi:hypothetical protein
MSPPKKSKYDRQFTIHVTTRTFQHLETLAERQRTSVGDIVRQALREHLDVQDDLIGSRSRLGSRVVRQLEEMQNAFIRQHTHSSTLLLAAIILMQMKQGAQGSQMLEEIAQLAAHAGDEIKAVLGHTA